MQDAGIFGFDPDSRLFLVSRHARRTPGPALAGTMMRDGGNLESCRISISQEPRPIPDSCAAGAASAANIGRCAPGGGSTGAWLKFAANQVR